MSWYQPFYSKLLYKHIVLRGFCSRYLLGFTACQSLPTSDNSVPISYLDIISPLLCAIFGTTENVFPFSPTIVEQGNQIILSGTLKPECKD